MEVNGQDKYQINLSHKPAPRRWQGIVHKTFSGRTDQGGIWSEYSRRMLAFRLPTKRGWVDVAFRCLGWVRLGFLPRGWLAAPQKQAAPKARFFPSRGSKGTVLAVAGARVGRNDRLSAPRGEEPEAIRDSKEFAAPPESSAFRRYCRLLSWKEDPFHPALKITRFAFGVEQEI